MPYLKKGGPLERLPEADNLQEFLEKLWMSNRGRPYFPTYIGSPDGESWEIPQHFRKKMVTQLQEFSGGAYNIDDPSPYTSDEIDPLKRLYDQYMTFLRPTQ